MQRLKIKTQKIKTLDQKYLIFDFDGVIGDTLQEYAKVVQATTDPDKTVPQIIKENIIKHHQKPQFGNWSEKQKIQWRKNLMLWADKIIEHDFDCFPDVINELLKIKNPKMAIVSGSSHNLLRYGINKANESLAEGFTPLHFDYMMGFEDGLSKVDRVLTICKEWNIEPSQAYFFTDTKTDVIELENTLDKDKIFGCAWGWHGYNRLKEVLPPDQILEEAFEIHRAIDNDKLSAEEKFYKNVEKNERKAENAEKYRLKKLKEAEFNQKIINEAIASGAVLDNEGEYLESYKAKLKAEEKAKTAIEQEKFLASQESNSEFDDEDIDYGQEYLGSEEEENEEYEEISTMITQTRKYVLLDSTGIRRPGQRTFGAESFATFRTIEEAYDADVICMVVDGSESLAHQDQVVAGIVQQAKKGVVVIVNKADLVDELGRVKFQLEFEHKFQFLKIKKFVWVSAKTGEGMNLIWNSIDYALEERNMDISREELRKLFNYLMKQKPPKKLRLEKRPVVYDLLYDNSKTPTFELLVKNKATIHWSYLRFLENTLRKNFGFVNTEIKVKAVNVSRKIVL
jgi:KH-domain-like of EngA bacterial GTPase enzymes, C-terminal/Haloacid dehalogenase-like hydrolase/CobW/HypB/UreG, nucleotide-binding domain